MKNLIMSAVIVTLGLGLSGCCNMGACPVRGRGAECAAHPMACAKCGAAKGQCKCQAAMTGLAMVGTQTLKRIVDSGVAVTLLDARVGTFDDGRRIPGAVSLSPDAKDEEIGRLLKNKNGLIVCYCANVQCPASRKLAVRLQGLGYPNVLEYAHGIEGWATAGYAVTPAAK